LNFGAFSFITMYRKLIASLSITDHHGG